jgi:hypothetical protein
VTQTAPFEAKPPAGNFATPIAGNAIGAALSAAGLAYWGWEAVQMGVAAAALGALAASGLFAFFTIGSWRLLRRTPRRIVIDHRSVTVVYGIGCDHASLADVSLDRAKGSRVCTLRMPSAKGLRRVTITARLFGCQFDDLCTRLESAATAAQSSGQA